MFSNYLNTAVRSFLRNRLYTFINIFGLAVGLACAILIFLFVRDELSYDKWLSGSENLYQLEITLTMPGGKPIEAAQVPYPLAALMASIPEVTAYTFVAPEKITVTIGDQQFAETVDVVDPNFLQVIKLPIMRGNASTALSQPNSVVLSETIAKKYFGSNDPMGRYIMLPRADCQESASACDKGMILMKVTGILKDLPHNTHLIADIVIPNTSKTDRIGLDEKESWFNMFGHAYVVLAPSSDPAAVLAKLKSSLDSTVNVKEIMNIDIPASKLLNVHMTSFKDVHLNGGRYLGNMRPPGNWTIIYGVSLIGLAILLLACFNFTNLATAGAAMRAKEIAVRKCLGANRLQLIEQFLGEAVLMAVISLVLALGLVEILLPFYSDFLGIHFKLHYISDWPFFGSVVAIAVLAGILSGIYPALVLSGFRPTSILGSTTFKYDGSSRLRTALVIFQFAVSIVLGVSAIIVYRQIDHVQTVDLGFDRNGIVVVNTFQRLGVSARDTFIQLLASHRGVTDVALSSQVPFSRSVNMATAHVPGQPETISVSKWLITPEFPSLYKMRLVAGRQLSELHADDVVVNKNVSENEGHNILVNETAAAKFGFRSQDAIGKTIVYNGNHVRIVGVLADAMVDGARSPIVPIVFLYDREDTMFVSVRIRPEATAETLGYIDAVWKRLAPTIALPRSNLNDNYDRLYASDRKQGTLFNIFVSIAIVIACLGLFGLAAFSVARRTREIGVRKVLGAKTYNIILLLLFQFSLPIIVANLISWPLAWYYLDNWLSGFSSRIALSPLYFLCVGLGTLIIGWATVFSHTYRVASASPIRALRYE